MVRFWPFGARDDNSPDSFERILSKLAAQVQSTASKLAVLRQRSRRYKALFTIYSVLGYILYCIVIVLVVGRQDVGLQESAGLIAGPLGIYVVRKLLDLYYGRRIASTEARLEDLQMEQRATIEKLKAATKFSTTQSLIEKYGGIAPAEPKQENKAPTTAPGARPPQGQRQQQQQQKQQQQPLPPLTPEQLRVQQQLQSQQKAGILPQPNQASPQQEQQPPPGVLPPAAPQSPQPLHLQGQTQPPSQQHLQPEEATAPRWYDRILDVVLGEDETSAKSRFALICKSCRMVNGLAPPGTRSLDEMGQWGCARCGTMNGHAKRYLPTVPEIKYEEQQESEPEEEAPRPKPLPVRVTRSKSKREESVATDADKDGEGSVKQEEGSSSEEEAPKPKPKPKGKGKRKA